MRMRKLVGIYVAGFALLFTACGGDSAQTAAQDPEQSGTQQESDMTVAAMEELPNCTETREGQTALVTVDSSTYLCGSGKWVFVSAPTPTVESLDDLSNCSASKEGDTVKVESESAIFRCEDGKWEKYRALTDTLVSAEDLLACVSKREGNTAYVVEEHALYSCEDGAWNRTVTFMDTTSSKDDLPNCTQKNEGDSSYVSKEKAVYLCIEGAWRHLGGVASTSDELPNCTENREGSRTLVVSEHVTLVCSEGKWYSYDIFQDIEEEKTVESGSSSSEVVNLSSSSESVNPTLTETLTDPRDGQTYRTVTIESQTWMAQNLNYETANSYYYGDSANHCTESECGRLYTWEAALTACPSGWHLPSEAEFDTLFEAVHVQSTTVAGALRASSLRWIWFGPGIDSGPGDDTFGFSALPAGFRRCDGSYDGFLTAYFWSANESKSSSDYARVMDLSRRAQFIGLNKCDALSVRCLKD